MPIHDLPSSKNYIQPTDKNIVEVSGAELEEKTKENETYNINLKNDILKQKEKQNLEYELLKKRLYENTDNISYTELKSLLTQKKYDDIREYAKLNDEFRASMHEAAHLIVGKKGAKKPIAIDTVSLGKENNKNSPGVQKKIEGESSGRVQWKSFFSFSDQQFVQTSLAGYVFERGLGLSHEVAGTHAQQDFHDILNRPGYEYIYENGRKPSGFNEKGDLICEKGDNLVSSSEIQNVLIQIAYKELTSVGTLLANNRDLLYSLGIELYENKTLDDEKVNLLINSESKSNPEQSDLPNIGLEQAFDYGDVAKYNIMYEGKKVGFIDVGKNTESTEITVGDVEIKENLKGKKIGIATYIEIVNIFQKPIISFMQSDEANRMRKGLVKRGLAEEYGEGGYKFKDLSVLVSEGKAFKNETTGKIEMRPPNI